MKANSWACEGSSFFVTLSKAKSLLSLFPKRYFAVFNMTGFLLLESFAHKDSSGTAVLLE